MLVFVALLAFALLGMAALTVDLGLAAAEQNRLEVAADAMALAALRLEARVAYSPPADGESDLQSWPRHVVDTILDETSSAIDGDVDLGLGPRQPEDELERCEGEVECWTAEIARAVPLLFGQGSLVSFQATSVREIMDAREAGALLAGSGNPVPGALRLRGIPIRGVARAEVRPALVVGEPQPGYGVPGRAPFALERHFWSALEDGQSRALDPSDGTLLSGGEGVGQVLGDQEGFHAGSRLSLPVAGNVETSGDVYVPLYREDEGGSSRMVEAFGFATVNVDPSGRVVVTKRDLRVAPANASASPRALAIAIARAPAESTAELSELPPSGSDLLRAPVLR